MEVTIEKSARLSNECTVQVQPEDGKASKIVVIPLAKMASDSWDPDELCVKSLTFVLKSSAPKGSKSCPSSKIVFCGGYEYAEKKYEQMQQPDSPDDTTWTFDGGVFHTVTLGKDNGGIQYFSSPSLNGQLCTLRLIVDHRVLVKDACVLIESDGVVASVTMEAGNHKDVQLSTVPTKDGQKPRKKRRGGV